jgi:hypothetical protein
MAIIPIYHVVADNYPVDPNTLDIKEGMFVALNGANGVRRVTTGDQGKVIGIAGDTKSSSASSMPGIYPGWQNRVSDSFDETKASAKLTVYHSGGKFATDQFVTTNLDASHLGQYLLVSESTGTLALDGATKTANTVAQLTRPAGLYPSGVPGIDIEQSGGTIGFNDINGDMALRGDNSNQYIEFKLLI